MAKPNRIKELEAEHGDLHQIIPKLVNQGGQKLAAQQLGTSQTTISAWLKTNGYSVKTFWVLDADARAAVAATLQALPIRRERQEGRESEAVL